MTKDKKLTILVDMDDTIEFLLEAWVKYLNNKYNFDVKLDDIYDFDMSITYPTLSWEQIWEPLRLEEFWKTVRPIPYADYVLEKLIEDGHSVYIVTSSYYKTLQPKFDHVLFKYFPFLKNKNVIIASRKQMIKGDILIDDYPENLIGGDYIKFLMTAPYNRNFVSDEVIRVNGWLEIYKKIQDIVRGGDI